jgi:membrane-associated phospholipid phosphatase
MSFPLPIFVLTVIALAVGSLVSLAAFRFVPAEGATAAAADAVEHAAESLTRRRRWLRARLDPVAATGLALTVALVATIAGGLIIGVLALLVRQSGTLRAIDGSAAAWGNDHATHLSTRLLTLVTDLGDWPLVPVVAIAVLLIEWYRRPNRWLLPFMLVVVFGNEIVTAVLKNAMDRARPTLNPLAATLGPSFPSGHSSTAASLYAAVALILARGRGPRARALLIGLAVGIAVAVATSRVLLDVHWLSDVIAGVSLGWAWFAISAIAFGGRLLRFGAMAEKLASKAPSPIGRPRAS